jgi:hypothetical protein
MQVMWDEGATLLAEPGAWRAQAVGEYVRSLPERREALKAELSARVFGLTGRCIPPEDLHAEEISAVAGIDGATFRLYREGRLVLMHACAHCGTGRFESPEIGSRADLGYALSDWRPVHEACEDFSSEDLASW